MTLTAESKLTPAEHKLLCRLGGDEETALRLIADRIGPAGASKHEVLAELGYEIQDGTVVSTEPEPEPVEEES